MILRKDLKMTLILEKQSLNKLNQEINLKRGKRFQKLIQQMINPKWLLMKRNKNKDLRMILILEKKFQHKLNKETYLKREKKFQKLIQQMINQRLLLMKRNRNKDLRMILMLENDLKLSQMIQRKDLKMILILEKKFQHKLNQETYLKREKKFQKQTKQMINPRLLLMKRNKNKDLRMILMLVNDQLFKIIREDQKMILMLVKKSFQ